jgi:cobalt-zinc-cadmium efflux system protein
MSTTETALTGHLVIPDGHPGNDFLAAAQRTLRERFGIQHATLQIEVGRSRLHGTEEACPLDGHAEHEARGHDHAHHDHAHQDHAHHDRAHKH